MYIYSRLHILYSVHNILLVQKPLFNVLNYYIEEIAMAEREQELETLHLDGVRADLCEDSLRSLEERVGTFTEGIARIVRAELKNRPQPRGRLSNHQRPPLPGIPIAHQSSRDSDETEDEDDEDTKEMLIPSAKPLKIDVEKADRIHLQKMQRFKFDVCCSDTYG